MGYRRDLVVGGDRRLVVPLAADNTAIEGFKISDDVEKFNVNLDSVLHCVGIVLSESEKKMIIE